METDERKRFLNSLYYTVFVRDNGKLYCRKMMPFKIGLIHADGGWKEIPYESIPVDGARVNEEEVYDLYQGKRALEKLLEVENNRCLAEDERILNLAKKTKRRVIGWTYCPFGGKLRENRDSSDEVYAAFIKDILDHGYLFSGEAYQDLEMEPVLDDYTYGSFTRRGFGAMMALCQGEHGFFSYASYSDEVEPWENSVRPSAGLYPEYVLANENAIEVDEKTFADMKRRSEEVDSYEEPLYLLGVPFPKEGEFYFLGEAIYIRNKDTMEETYHILRLIQKRSPGEPLISEDMEGVRDYFYPKDMPSFDSPFLLLGIGLDVF